MELSIPRATKPPAGKPAKPPGSSPAKSSAGKPAKSLAGKPAKPVAGKSARAGAGKPAKPGTPTRSAAKSAKPAKAAVPRPAAAKAAAKPAARTGSAKAGAGKPAPAHKPAALPRQATGGETRPRARRPKPPAQDGVPSVEAILALIERSLDDDKAEAVSTIPLAGKTSMADYMVIASGRSARQVGAMADHLARKLKTEGRRQVQVEGVPACDWVLVDCGDIIVHLFRPEVRSFYNLEKMWGMALPDGLADGATARG